MSKGKTSTIAVRGTAVSIISGNDGDYLSLTDTARHRDSSEPFAFINNWMRGLWEQLSNPGVKPLGFGRFRNQAGISQMRTLLERSIRPEYLPPAEDVKKVEHRLTSEEKK
jgi:hypothetical protein